MSLARRAWISVRTEGGNSSRRDRSCAIAAAMPTVGSSRQVPSASSRDTSSSRSRNSLSVSSRYNGCPLVCANRKSASITSGVSCACEGKAPGLVIEERTVTCSPSPTSALMSWSVSAWLRVCNDICVTGRSRPRLTN